tara:strand:- start:111 stop:407 length:297 start_codon:yes stop_codon:yes gene_type:complete
MDMKTEKTLIELIKSIPTREDIIDDLDDKLDDEDHLTALEDNQYNFDEIVEQSEMFQNVVLELDAAREEIVELKTMLGRHMTLLMTGVESSRPSGRKV